MAKKKKVSQEVEKRSDLISIGDPSFATTYADFLGLGSLPGSHVSENTALGITAFYRAVSLIAGTIATLPLKTYKKDDSGVKTLTNSFLDNPAGPYPLSPFAWNELVLAHLLIQGEAFLLHIYNQGGALIGLYPIHRQYVSKVEWAGTEKLFTISTGQGNKTYSSQELTHIMGLTTDGIRGIAPLTAFRQAVRLGIAGETAAARSFSNGLLLSGMVTTKEEDMEQAEAEQIVSKIRRTHAGVDNAGDIAFFNRQLTFTPWSMSNEDAQFLQSREFQVVEFARMFGVPPHLLAITGAVSQFGTGVEENNRGMARYTFMPYTSRIEQALSPLLMGTKFVEYDYKGLLQGSPAQEIEMVIAEMQAGLITKEEARQILNLGPMPGGELDDTGSDPTV